MRLRAFAAAATAVVALSAPALAVAKKRLPDGISGNDTASADAAGRPASKGERERIGRSDPLSQAAFWTAELNKDKSDLEAAQKLAEVLRHIGKPDRAVEVANQALGYHPSDKLLLLIGGRALIETGDAAQASVALLSAAQLDPKDWRPLSALGVAYDSMGRRAEAQQTYERALKLDPGNAGLLSNLGLSLALSGDLRKAETTLRAAVAAPGADAQVRQNLTLVLGQLGRFAEAQDIALQDLPPDAAADNISFLRSMATSGRRWDSLKTGIGLKTTS